jgi:hypothetical protein
MRRVLASIAAVTVFAANPGFAQNPPPGKQVWALNNNRQVQGTFAGFGDHWCWLSRRRGKLFLNREQVPEPLDANAAARWALVQEFGKQRGVNLDDPQDVHAKLAKIIPCPAPPGVIYGKAEFGFRFYTLKLTSHGGVVEVPLVFLTPADFNTIKSDFVAWEQEVLEAEREERFRQQVLARLDETNRILQQIATALWWQVNQ